MLLIHVCTLWLNQAFAKWHCFKMPGPSILVGIPSTFQGFWYFMQSQSCENQVNPWNPWNLIKYMSVQHIWNLFWLLGLFTCCKLATLSSSLKSANNILKLPGINYVVKNWALAMMLKALPLVHFWSVLLLKDHLCWKMLKTLVWSVQNRLISSGICLENTHKICRWKLPWNYRKIDRFLRESVPKNPAKFDFFFRDLSEVLTFGPLIHKQLGLYW